MEFLSNMTRAEKERYVIEPYKQDKIMREIVQRVHMSPRDVAAIIKDYKDKIERENGQTEVKDGYDMKLILKETQAIKMFSEDKSPTEVLVELDLEPEEVRTILRRYLETKDMYEFLQIYEQIKHSSKYSFSSFCKIYQIFEDLRMTEQQISDALRLAKHHQLDRLQWNVEYLVNDIRKLDMEIKNKKSILATLDEIIGNLKCRADGKSEERTREFSLKEGFRLGRNERTEPGMGMQRTHKEDNLKNSYNSDYNIEVFYASGDWKGISDGT